MHAVVGDGSKHNKVDPSNAGGLSAEEFAKQMVKAIQSRKEEIYIGKMKERMGVLLKRFFPRILSKVIRKVR
jgi:short-subunit dehydrogenase